eukprot:scaffold163_cov142-Isochrysis_galbana.AAC.4
MPRRGVAPPALGLNGAGRAVPGGMRIWSIWAHVGSGLSWLCVRARDAPVWAVYHPRRARKQLATATLSSGSTWRVH